MILDDTPDAHRLRARQADALLDLHTQGVSVQVTVLRTVAAFPSHPLTRTQARNMRFCGVWVRHAYQATLTRRGRQPVRIVTETAGGLLERLEAIARTPPLLPITQTRSRRR